MLTLPLRADVVRYFLCFLAAVSLAAHPALAQEEPDNLLANGNFTETADSGAPAGWDHRTKDSSPLKVITEGDTSFVRIEVKEAGNDNFIQQVAKLTPEIKKVALDVKYRHADIVAGEKGHMKGKVQGRFTKAGKETGSWIDLGDLTGTSEGWIEKQRTVSVPADVDGLMLRLGFYGVKSGRLDVAHAIAAPVTAEDVAADRAKYRPAEPYGNPVSDARYNRLNQGININNWFCQPWNIKVNGQKGGFNAETLRGYITEHDIQLIKQAGFDHIRLPVDPTFLMNNETGELKTELLGELDRAIEMIVDSGLAVIVDVHPKSPAYKKMAGKPIADNFITWWGHFGKHLSQTDAEYVFLELLNEPGGQGFWESNYPAYQDKLIMKVRENAPEHTLIANPGGYMLFREITKHEPHTDRNVIYAMHYYEPSPFTHQGAIWMKDWYRPLRQVPWPLTEENLAEAQARIDEKDKAAAKAKEAISGIAKSGWGSPDSITKQMAEMAAWAKKNDRRLVIGEWGVYTKYAAREDRLRYLDYMTKAMADAGIGWSKWDYCGAGFDIVENPAAPSAERKLDPEVIKALNLSTSVTQAN